MLNFVSVFILTYFSKQLHDKGMGAVGLILGGIFTTQVGVNVFCQLPSQAPYFFIPVQTCSL